MNSPVKNNPKKISLCFPVYQNAGSLDELYLRSRRALEGNFRNFDFEFVFVNDGSADSSLQELIRIKTENNDDRIKIIDFSRNFGQVAAILAGWKFATGDAVINLAADLQDPPEQCVNMVKEWIAGNEIVISYRKSHKSSGFKNITSFLAYKILLPQSPRGGFDFVLFGRKSLEAMLSLQDCNRFFQHDVLWLGFSVKFIPYDKLERKVGRSQWGHLKRFNYFLTGYLNSTYLPLRIFSVIGLLFSISSVVYSLLIIYAYLHKQTPFAGWAPIMILLLMVGGLIMIMLGIIGEYLWRIFEEVKRRPKFLINEII
jgi:glycosyltransferase involved in cell wall biosynthesis